MYGSGLQIRRFKDLVKWEYVGWEFSSLSGATYKLKVERERDWENKVTSTLIFTGLDNTGTLFGEEEVSVE